MSRRDHHSTSHNDKQNDEKQRNEYLVVYWKRILLHPVQNTDIRRQRILQQSSRQTASRPSTANILLRSGTIHFKKSKSSDPEIFTTFSKYVGKKRKEKETKNHTETERNTETKAYRKKESTLCHCRWPQQGGQRHPCQQQQQQRQLPQSKTVKKTQR